MASEHEVHEVEHDGDSDTGDEELITFLIVGLDANTESLLALAQEVFLVPRHAEHVGNGQRQHAHEVTNEEVVIDVKPS